MLKCLFHHKPDLIVVQTSILKLKLTDPLLLSLANLSTTQFSTKLSLLFSDSLAFITPLVFVSREKGREVIAEARR